MNMCPLNYQSSGAPAQDVKFIRYMQISTARKRDYLPSDTSF